MGQDKFDTGWLESPAVQAVIEVISRRVTEQVIAQHVASCPHGQQLRARVALLTGVALGSGMAGGGAVLAILRAVSTGSP
jgi:hypothetical protein